MTSPGPSASNIQGTAESFVERIQPSHDSQITWLLNRAAQRMRRLTGEQSEAYGLQVRDYVVLSSLIVTSHLTQGQLAKALGLDKTTLMSQLDRLENAGLISRLSDPQDRRRRLPVITAAGEAVRAQASQACAEAEAASLSTFTDEQIGLLRKMLVEIIGQDEDRGSCL